MNLDEYKTLTGKTISASDESLYNAQITRTQYMLETLLGFTLDFTKVNTNEYDELGKTTQDCVCPSVDAEDLLPADSVTYAYRLFPYYKEDKYFHIDAATEIYSVKLVHVRGGSGSPGVTLKTFDIDNIRLVKKHRGVINFMENCKDCLCETECACRECMQLAVDAKWAWESLNDMPMDLKYLWSDMVTFNVDNIDNIKSESIDSHSYTKFDIKSPHLTNDGMRILEKYAGPSGTAVPFIT